MGTLGEERQLLNFGSGDSTNTFLREEEKGEGNKNLLLLLLLLLIIPLVFLIYLVIRYCRKYRYRRLARKVKLWGSQHPGDVDDLEMGDAVDGGGEWLTRRERLQSFAAGNTIPSPDVATEAVKEFDPICAEAEKHKKRWQRHRHHDDYNNGENTGNNNNNGGADAHSNNSNEMRAEREFTVDDTDDTTTFKGCGSAAVYDAATTRVWLKGLVTEAGAIAADGGGNDDDNNNKKIMPPKTGEAEQMSRRASSHDAHQSQPFLSRKKSRCFEEILTSVAPAEVLPAAFHEKTLASQKKLHSRP